MRRFFTSLTIALTLAQAVPAGWIIPARVTAPSAAADCWADLCKVCGRAPEDGEHVSCIEIYAQSMQSTDDTPIPPARIDIAIESVVVLPCVVYDRVTRADQALDRPVQLSPPFKVPIA